MEHLSFEQLNSYIGMSEYTDENAELFETISEHLMECEECAEKYRKILLANQVTQEFSLEEYGRMLTYEDRLLERYQLLKLISATSESEIGGRIKNWLRKKSKGIENSIQVHLCDEKLHRISGMLTRSMEKLSSLANLQPGALIAVRGEGDVEKELSTVLVSSKYPDNKVCLDGNTMSFYIQIEDKGQDQEPPIGILLPKDKEGDPIVEAAKKENGFYRIAFTNLKPGEYMFYFEE